MEHSPQSFVSGGKQHIFQCTPCRGEIVERALLRRFEQRAGKLAEERDDEQSALHQHLLLLGQGIGKHRHLVFVVRFVHFGNQFLERSHVFCQRGNDLGYVFPSAHHDKFKLAQMVVGRSLERRTDNSFQNLIAYFTVGKVAVCVPLFQYFIKFHLAIFIKVRHSCFYHCKGNARYCFVFA